MTGYIMPLLSRWSLIVIAAVLFGSTMAQAMIGLNRTELERVYGPVQEESESVYAGDLKDLLFLAKSSGDGNSIIIATTMLHDRCHAVSYVKRDPQDQPAPLLPEELRNQMIASSKSAGGVWEQISPTEWKSDPGPDVPGGLKAFWPKPELFQIFTRELLERTGRKW